MAKIKKRSRKKVKIRRHYADKSCYTLNPEFEFFSELKGLILKSSPAEKDKMIKRLSGVGRIKLAVISGVFLSGPNSLDVADSEVDLFIVGDDISKDKLRTFLRSLEAEVGKELKLGIMDKDEFEYRYSMFRYSITSFNITGLCIMQPADSNLQIMRIYKYSHVPIC